MLTYLFHLVLLFVLLGCQGANSDSLKYLEKARVYKDKWYGEAVEIDHLSQQQYSLYKKVFKRNKYVVSNALFR